MGGQGLWTNRAGARRHDRSHLALAHGHRRNRDPDGASLYPGQATTELCPLTTFDGEPLYRTALDPAEAEIASRRAEYFAPYHAAISTEIERLRAVHPRVVLYDAHSIRSRIPRLFPGLLPHLNIGTNGETSCDPALTRRVELACQDPQLTCVTNGRFRGGWTIRHYGQPRREIHALQMELACRGYLREPEGTLSPDNWPVTFDAALADALRAALGKVLRICLEFASGGDPSIASEGSRPVTERDWSGNRV